MTEPVRYGLDDFNDVYYDGPLDDLPSPNGQHDPPFKLQALTARELLAIPDPPEEDLLLGPLVLRAARTIIVGDTGHGKTTLALQVCAAILTGDELLGYQGAGAGPVMFVDVEQGLRSIKRGLRESGLHDRDDVIYVAQPDGLELDRNEHHRQALEQAVAEHKPSVLSLDPYYKAHRGEANEERAVTDLMRYLDRLRDQHRFALLLPAHPRKDRESSPTRKLTLHDVSGSGAAVRGAEVIIAIERLSYGYARLRILKDRDGDLPVGEAWQLTYNRQQGFQKDEERSEESIEKRILADETGDWRTSKEWAAVIGLRHMETKRTLERLAATGKITSTVGPPGRSPRALCYSTAPSLWEQSGAVESEIPDGTTAPTAPTPIGSSSDGSSRESTVTAPRNPGAVEEQWSLQPDQDIPF